jgi:hypothetical protein
MFRLYRTINKKIFFYLWFFIQSNDGYIQPKHIADLYADEVVFGL